ncbi:SpoIIE family protein phosphatase, partial [Acidobacteriota bacterium]
MILLYTDGLSEAFDGSGEQYGTERICSIFDKNHQSSTEERIST